MKQCENNTREELLAIIKELERKVKILSSSHATSPVKCFREKYATQILDALPDMLTVLDRNANMVELVSFPSTNHVEGVSEENFIHSNIKDILPKEAYESVRKNIENVIRTDKSSVSRHDLPVNGSMIGISWDITNIKKVEDGGNDDTYVYGDWNRIMQVVNNLLSNAIKFTIKGEIHFGFHKKDNFAKFYVKDSGIGIRYPKRKSNYYFPTFWKSKRFYPRYWTWTHHLQNVDRKKWEVAFGCIRQKQKAPLSTSLYQSVNYSIYF